MMPILINEVNIKLVALYVKCSYLMRQLFVELKQQDFNFSLHQGPREVQQTKRKTFLRSL